MGAERAARFIRAAAEQNFGGRLIDIGCGAKWKADLVGDLVDEYVGLDHAGSMHDVSQVDLLGSADAIPAPDASFDCALCTSVLEHLEEPRAALAECWRVLKPGGTAIYTVPMYWHLHEQPRDFYRYTPFGLRYLFEKVGFERVEVTPMAGFWVTYASELGYYWLSATPRVMRPLVSVCTFVANVVTPLIDGIECKIHRRSHEWAWMQLVVSRKPRAREQ